MYVRNKEQWKSYYRSWYLKNKEKQLKTNRNYHKELKIAVLTRYGGKCACCGVSEIDFLAIDHIEGGGNKHRKEIGCKSGTRFYSWLRQNNYPSGFQVLCHNCNFSKNINKGLCIHQINKMNENITE